MSETKVTPTELNIQSSVQSFTNTGAGGGTFYYVNEGGVKKLWGQTNTFSVGASLGTATISIVPPTGFFTTVQSAVASIGPNGQQFLIHNGAGPTNISFIVQNQQSSIVGEYVVVYAIGS